MINVERIEILGLNVHDVEAATALFSRLFGIDFLACVVGGEPPEGSPHRRLKVDRDDPLGILTSTDRQNPGQATLTAIDTSGYFELIESHRSHERDEMRNIHFKVADIDAAVREIQREGIGIVANVTAGRLREVVLDSADLFGARICLVQYEGRSLIEAMLG